MTEMEEKERIKLEPLFFGVNNCILCGIEHKGDNIFEQLKPKC